MYKFTIGPEHVGRLKTKEDLFLRGAIGRVMSIDIGKKVYEVSPGIYQVENNEQRNKRIKK